MMLGEMTLVDPNVSSKMLYDYLEEVEPLLLSDKAEHIGDIEEYQLKHIKYNTFEVYGLISPNDNRVASVFKCRIKNNFPKLDKVLYVSVMVTHQDFAQRSLSAKMIHFFQTREVWDILIDELISPANKANLEKIAKDPHSGTCWYNVKTGKIDEFDNTNDKYTHNIFQPQTNWQVLFRKRWKSVNEDTFKTEEVYSRFWKKDHILECRMLSGYHMATPGTD